MSGGFDERELAIGRVYAAVVLGLASKAGTADAVLNELDEVKSVLDRSPQLEDALASPLVDAESRREIVEKAFRNRASDLVVNSLQVLNDKGRLSVLRAFIEGYRQEFEEKNGITEVDVTTAAKLSAEQRARAEEVASGWTGGSVRLVEIVDPEIIGGVVFRAGDRELNRSVSRELNAMKTRFLERASQHIQDPALAEE